MGLGTALILLLLTVGFLPTIIAFWRRHRNRWAIFITCLICQLTGGFFPPLLLLWVGALIWSFTSNTEPEPATD